MSQNTQKQFRGVRSMKELTETTHNLSDYRMKFEATRSFELEDDFDFIPNLLTDSDVSLPLAVVLQAKHSSIPVGPRLITVKCRGSRLHRLSDRP